MRLNTSVVLEDQKGETTPIEESLGALDVYGPTIGLETGRKDYGNGTLIRVVVTVPSAATPESRAAAMDQGIKECIDALERNKDAINNVLRATAGHVGDGRGWDPSGRSLAPAVAPAAPKAPPIPAAPPVPASPAIRRPPPPPV